MRLISLVFILVVILPGCSLTSSSLHLSTGLKSDQSSDIIRESLTEKRFKELDTVLASDIKTRDLPRAKSLISELKNTITSDHARQKELKIAEAWINESIAYRENIELLEERTRLLRSEISKHKEALEDVRRTLVSE